MLKPREAFDLDEETDVGVARGVQWWDAQMPPLCKVVNTTKSACLVRKGRVVAKAVPDNVQNRERLQNLCVPDSGTTLKSKQEDGGTYLGPAPTEIGVVGHEGGSRN